MLGLHQEPLWLGLNHAGRIAPYVKTIKEERRRRTEIVKITLLSILLRFLSYNLKKSRKACKRKDFEQQSPNLGRWFVRYKWIKKKERD